MAINSTAIAQELKPGLAAISGMYEHYESEWKEIFSVYQSHKAVEIEVENRFLGLAQIRPEGAPTAIDDGMGQRSITQYLHRTIALSFTITRNALADNLYKEEFPRTAKALLNSLRVTKETLGAAILNNAFNPAYPIGDGQPLCSLNHPYDGGFIPNTAVGAIDLNEASLEAAVIAVAQFLDPAGLPIKILPQKLIVPVQLQYVADRILGSDYQYNTANNAINALKHMKSVPQGFRVNHYLTQPNSWFLLTNAEQGFKMYQREPFETDMYTDPSTQNILSTAFERYSFGVTDFRSVYGVQGF